MEHKVNDIITYNHNGETIYLKVVEDFDCINCFFYSAACCSDIRNDIGDCLNIRRTDKTPVIFKKVNNKTMNNKFDTNTLKPFDKVLVRDDNKDKWFCEFFSHKLGANVFRYICISGGYKQCIPYNDDTKHLVGTKDEAPEYYRYWEE